MKVKLLYMALFLTCASAPLLAGGYDDDTKEDFDRDTILDKVENIIWECAKHNLTDLAVSLSSAIVNHPYTTTEDHIRFLGIRSKMYLLNGDIEDYQGDKALRLKKMLPSKG